ncbi:MAG: chorismate synthase, partial [Candidatus Cloacimonetes bacterium]|nr:chorismate synthase [Candidatus Cloacimonadota bacterium]
VTTGMPICLLVYNQDARSKDYSHLKDIFRPGHADYSWYKKFKIFDHRGGGRASGRETISRVAAGAVVNEILGNINIALYPIKIGNIYANNFDNFPNELNWPDSTNYEQVLEYLNKIKAEGNSAGGIVEVVISNLPPGLGDPVFEKLDANLAKAIVSIGAVKGIEFGSGFEFSGLTGKEANDELNSNGFISNNCGGILGGVSSGEEIRFRFVVKPTPSINLEQQTISHENKEIKFQTGGRHDILIIPRIIPVAEAMIKLVLADAISHQKLISKQDLQLSDLREAFDKIDEDILIALSRRQQLSAIIGKLKKQQNIPIEDKDREIKMLDNLIEKANKMGMSSKFIENIWSEILKESKKNQ